MTQSALQTGHDAPVTDRSEDFYDRWPTAKSISHIIATAPPQWSTRIGLFGPWGDGKTSVLNFVEQQQRDAGNIVIRYAPWGASTADEVWKDFGKVLIAGLKRHGVKLTLWARAVHLVKAMGAKAVAGVLKGIGKLAELTGHAPGVSAGANFASTLIGDKLTFTKEDMLRLIQQLGARRVVVFIDDLDRTEPAVVPKLLLVLRELLDFAQFAFVLAFDRKIVAASLQGSNQSWGNSGESFLDKVIDFRVDLPKPTADQVRLLGLDQFQKLCPFVPRESVEAVAKLLPTNPRRLKLLARMIASTKKEVERHDADELEWGVILLLALVRAESEAFATKLLAITIDNVEYDFGEAFEGSANREARKKEELRLLLEEFPELKPRKERIELLVGAWREEVPAVPGERIRYQAMFSLTPHYITWGEFKQFFVKWRSDKLVSLVADFVTDRISASEARPESVQSELSDTVLSHYSTVLETASGVQEKAVHQKLVDEANDTLDLFLQSVTGQQPVCALSREQLIKLFERLRGIAMQWRHFDANDGEPELRAKEVQTLIDLGGVANDPMTIYEKLSPGRSQDSFFDQRDGDLRNAMIEDLRAVFEPMARTAALSYVTVPGQIRKLRSRDEGRAVRLLLTSPKSPFFAAHKADLVAAFKARLKSPGVVEDAGDYLSLLLSALEHGDQVIATAAERQNFIKEHPEFMRLIWELCVSEPSQFRMLKGLREQRATLIKTGIADADLMQPQWLKVTTTDLKSQPELGEGEND